MQREIDGQTFVTRGLVEAAITNVVAPNRRNAAYGKAVEYLMQGNALCKGGSYRGLRKSLLSSKDEFDIRQAAAAFKILKRTNFYDIMASTLKAETKRR
jgi:hypothetical protein